MPLRPLPVPTRCDHGENVTSYARRLFARNHVTWQATSAWLRETVGAIDGYSSREPAFLNAVRTLGALHKSAFTFPDTIFGNWVVDRPLCRGCTHGNDARGRLPYKGSVCLRHKRWLDTPAQHNIRDFPEAIRAERYFRRHLIGRGVLFDAPVMRLSRDLAAVAADPYMTQRISDRRGLPEDVIHCPTQVRLADWLTMYSVVRTLADPDRQKEATELIRFIVKMTCPHSQDAQHHRAETLLFYVSERLRKRVIYGRIVGRNSDDPWNMLRQAGLVQELTPEPL